MAAAGGDFAAFLGVGRRLLMACSRGCVADHSGAERRRCGASGCGATPIVWGWGLRRVGRENEAMEADQQPTEEVNVVSTTGQQGPPFVVRRFVRAVCE